MDDESLFLSKSYRSFKSFSALNNSSLVLVLITYGTGRLFINGQMHGIKRGTLCFFTPFDAYLFEADSEIELQAWVVEFSLEMILDFISDPFIDLDTFQVLRRKNEITQLNNDRVIEVNQMIEDISPEPSSDSILVYFRNRNILKILFALANDSISTMPIGVIL